MPAPLRPENVAVLWVTVPVYETAPPEHEKLVAQLFWVTTQVSSPHVPATAHVPSMLAHPADPELPEAPELPEPPELLEAPELPDDAPELLVPPVVVVLEHAATENAANAPTKKSENAGNEKQ